MSKRQIPYGQRVPLMLTAAQRTLLVDGLECLDQEYEQLVRQTPFIEPIMMALNELDDLTGFVAAEDNHCGQPTKCRRLDALFEKILNLLDRYVEPAEEQSPTAKDE